MLNVWFARGDRFRFRFSDFNLVCFRFRGSDDGLHVIFLESGFSVVVGFCNEKETQEEDSGAGSCTGPVGLLPFGEHVTRREGCDGSKTQGGGVKCQDGAPFVKEEDTTVKLGDSGARTHRQP